jgi:2-methylcitrate dehydratase PrpD
MIMKKILAKHLAEFYSGCELENISDQVVQKAKLSLLDYLFVYVAGFRSGVLKDSILDYYSNRIKNDESTILLTGTKADAEIATMVSGLIAHSVELDDGHRYGTAHPAVAVIPAALAIAEKENASFNELIKAIIIGYDAMLRLSKSINPSHLKRGFHSTSTTGTIGAAAAVASVLKFKADDFVNAISIAGLLSSGLQEMLHGNPSIKAFQVGRSAQSGLLAAQFVTYGGKGPASIFEGQHGWIKAMTDEFDESVLLDELGKRWEIMNTYTKLYPTCRHCHHAIDLAIEAFQSGLSIDKIEKVIVKTYTVGIAEVGIIKRPANVEDAMFSLAFAVSVALTTGFVTLEYLQEYLSSNGLLDFSEKIEIEADAAMDSKYPAERGCIMELITKTGELFKLQTHLPKGEPDTALTNEEYLNKFKAITAGVFKPEFVEEIFDFTMNYPDNIGFIEQIDKKFILNLLKL